MKNNNEEALELVRQLLIEDEPINVTEVFSEAKKAGISRASLNSAKTELGLRVIRIGGDWYWQKQPLTSGI